MISHRLPINELLNWKKGGYILGQYTMPKLCTSKCQTCWHEFISRPHMMKEPAIVKQTEQLIEYGFKKKSCKGLFWLLLRFDWETGPVISAVSSQSQPTLFQTCKHISENANGFKLQFGQFQTISFMLLCCWSIWCELSQKQRELQSSPTIWATEDTHLLMIQSGKRRELYCKYSRGRCVFMSINSCTSTLKFILFRSSCSYCTCVCVCV